MKSFDYRQDIFGQQYLDIPQNKKISVQVEIEVMEGKLELLHDFSTHVGSIIHFSTDYKTYKKGQFLKAKYSVDSKSIFWDTEIRLYAKNFSGKTAKLKFHKAEVLVQNND